MTESPGRPLRCLCWLLTAVATLQYVPPAAAQNVTLGKIADKITCAAHPEQSYALYLPTTYSRQRKWPVIFCFDPAARGRLPVERFQAAAEKYGYIVAGSLNSRNGPLAQSGAAANAMMNDLDVRVSLDPNRIYTSGLSGGARIATAIAMSGLTKGVIACSAGFPPLPDGIPDEVPFLFYGTAGTEDFNYHELMGLDEELNRRRSAHHIAVFSGTHEWPPAEVLERAVEWLELQTMRTGVQAKNDAFVARMFEAATAALATQHGLERWRMLNHIAGDFRGLVDVKPFEQEAKELGATREMKEALKAERDLAEREERLAQQLGDWAFSKPGVKRTAFLTELRQKADAPNDSPERQLVRRVTGGFAVQVQESLSGWFERHEYGRAAAHLEAAALLRPGQTRTLFDLARARAFNRDAAGALDALEQAVAAGYRNAKRLEAEKAFTPLTNEPRFKAVLEKARTNGTRPDGA